MTAGLNRAERRKARKLEDRHRRANGQSADLVPRHATVPLREVLTAAVARHQAGDLAAAEKTYRDILAAFPAQADALQFLGILLHQKGRGEEGLALLREACEAAPDSPEVHANLGAVLTQLGQFGEAEASHRRALELQPDHLEARLNLVRTLVREGRMADAIAAGRAGIPLSPRALPLRKAAGELLVKTGAFEEAAAEFEACLEIAPTDATAMNDRAVCLRELGRCDEAERLYRRALELAPEITPIRYNFGGLLMSQGRTEEAHAELDKVLAVDPSHWMAVTLLAINLAKIGRESEAVAMLHQVAKAHPDDAVVWNDVGAQFMHMGKFEEAKAMFARACEIDPARVEARTNLGNANLKQGLGHAAIAEYEKALKLRPRHLEAHVALCRMLKEVYRLDEANMYAHGTILLPGYGPKYFSNPLQVFRATCDYEGVAAVGELETLCESVPAIDLTTALLQLLVYSEDDAASRMLAAHVRVWSEEVEAKAARSPLPARPRPAAKGKLRIGFLSADLRTHAVAKFLGPVMRAYDRERFEFFCYSPVKMPDDPRQKEFRASVDKFTYVDNLTDREVAAAIQADDIDILLELNGFTHGTRLPAVAYRPAPVQIAWLGYPFTTTFTTIDYILVDEFLKPAVPDLTFEKPLVIAGSSICFGKFPEVPIETPPPCAREGRITFGTLNNTYKFTPEVIATWAEVMRAVPGSRLLVVRPELGSMIACRNIAQELVKNGISTDRLYLLNNRGKSLNHLEYYNEIDVSLDAFPVTGGTTTCEAVWMGVPVIALEGNNIHQRVSSAVLNNAGFPELCAATRAEFVSKAVALAGDPARLAHYRETMRGAMLETTLCREDRFMENFQSMLEDVARRHGLR